MQTFIILILSIQILFATSEIFSSTDELINLKESKESLIQHLNNLIEDLKYDAELLERKVQSIKSELEIMEKDPQNYIANPLNAFILVKTLSHDIDAIQSSLEANFNNFKEDVSDIKLLSSDFEGAIAGFLLLQKTYELKSEDLVNGFIDGIRVRPKLSNLQVYTLGNEIIKQNHKIGAEYLEIAAAKTNDDDLKMQILDILLEVYKSDEKFGKATKVLTKMAKIQPENPDVKKDLYNFINLDDKLEPNNEKDLEGSHWTAYKEKVAFSHACMMKRNKNATESSKLYCKFHTTNAFTKIAPLKLEIANFLPFVGIFHDVLSDDEIEVLKEISKKNLRRAELASNVSITLERTAKLAWLKDNEHEVVATITRRVGDMSGLNMKTSEELQTQNYGIGGYYNLHFDFSQIGRDFTLGTGNRIATTLFYMTDVLKGGATVFPLMKISVPPRKGTAVFWHNLSTSGDRETLTLHAGCPVLIGSKWVANKWLHEYGQEWKRPCELHAMPVEANYAKYGLTL